MKVTSLIITVLVAANSFAISIDKNNNLTANEVINLIKANVNCDWADETVDTFKAGNPEDKVSGIAVCMFADMKLLKKAVLNNINLIITHEPTFYNHLDETDYLENDAVFKDKMKFINDNKLIIWRFHDHIHRMSPDGIYEGMIEELGWKSNKVNGSSIFYEFKKQKLCDFSTMLSEKFKTNGIRVVGNPDMEFTKVALAVGAPGSRTHILTLEDDRTDVLVAGESPEWETYEYVSDAVEQGKNKAVLFIGHIHSEEAGMKFCASWLKSFLDMPITYFKNGQAYWTPLSN